MAATSTPAGKRRPARVLVIDDERYVRTLLRRLLEFDGYDVVVSDDGIRGLAAAQQQRPDAIVLDLMMPVFDGFEVLAGLRTDPRTADVPVVVLTAAATIAARQRVTAAGATACLTKPFAPEELAAALSSASGPVRKTARVRSAAQRPGRVGTKPRFAEGSVRVAGAARLVLTDD